MDQLIHDYAYGVVAIPIYWFIPLLLAALAALFGEIAHAIKWLTRQPTVAAILDPAPARDEMSESEVRLRSLLAIKERVMVGEEEIGEFYRTAWNGIEALVDMAGSESHD